MIRQFREARLRATQTYGFKGWELLTAECRTFQRRMKSMRHKAVSEFCLIDALFRISQGLSIPLI